MNKERRNEVPIWCKSNLTVEEAAAYFNIGIKKIRELSEAVNCPYVLFIGTKRLIKRIKFEQFLDDQYSI